MSRRDERATGRLPGLAVGVAIALAAIARADPEGPLVIAGIGGVHRTGFWTPLAISLPADAPAAVRAWVADSDGQLVGSPPIQASMSDPTTAARACVRPGRPSATLAIEPLAIEPLATGQESGPEPAGGLRLPADRAPIPGATIASTTPLLLLHGRLPAAATAVRLVAGERTPAEVITLTSAPIPPRLTPRDLDAFDAAIICGRDAAALSRDTLSAIDGWVRCGGRLVFIAGGSAEAVAGSGPPAADWLPGTEPRLVSLRRFGSLEAFARAGGMTGRSPQAGVAVPRFATLAAPGGIVEAFEGTRSELPLVVRRAHGLGTITWLGVDIDEPWAAAWPGCDRLLAALLGSRADADEGLAVMDRGGPRVPDLAGQLRVALDTYPAPTPRRGVPFEVIAGLGVLYVLALYPLDWWLVSRSGRPWLSWLTLPTLAGGVAAAAWGVGGVWGHTAPPQCRVAEVLDFDATGGLVRGSSWFAVRSPTNGIVDVAVTVAAALPVTDVDAAVSWCADAGAGFGGVDAHTAHPTLAAHEYEYGTTLADLTGVPIAAASSRLFEAGWTAAASVPPATSTLVRDARGLIRGTLVHHLPFALRDCRLLHAGWLYDIGDFEPGETFDTEAGRGPRSLAAALTRRIAVGDRDRAERWDAAGIDVARILEVAGFHAAAGGTGYTALEPGRLRPLDLSPLLTVNRAVVVGLAPTGMRGTAWGVRLQRDGGDAVGLEPEAADSGMLVRIVIPLPEPEAAVAAATSTEEKP